MIKYWVKNVNNQRIKDSKTYSNLSTKTTLKTILSANMGVKMSVNIINEHSMYPDVSTIKNANLYLLFKSFTPNPHSLLLRPINKI